MTSYPNLTHFSATFIFDLISQAAHILNYKVMGIAMTKITKEPVFMMVVTAVALMSIQMTAQNVNVTVMLLILI